MSGMIVGTWSVLAVIFAASAIATVMRFRQPKTLHTATTSPCSIVLPVKDASRFLKANVLALAALEPFEGEILVAIARETDSAFPIVAPIIAANADRMTLLVGEASEFVNPKLRNIAKAYRASREDVTLFLDDSVELENALFCEAMASLEPGVVLVTAAPLGCNPTNFPAEIEAATCNGYVLRIQALLALFGSAGVFGNLMLFRKSDLEAAGGLRRLTESPCEDDAQAEALSSTGGRLRLLRSIPRRNIGERSWSDLRERHVRWKSCTKCQSLSAFLLEPLIGGLIFLLLGTFSLSDLFGIGWWPALGWSAAIWYGVETLLHVLCGWKMTLVSPLAWCARDILHPIFTFVALVTTRVRWRGEIIEMPLMRRRRPARTGD